MNLDIETVQHLERMAVNANRDKIHQVQQEPEGVYYLEHRDGRLERVVAEQKPRNHQLFTFDAFCEAVDFWQTGDDLAVVVFAVFFYGTGLASDLEEKYRGFSSLSLERFRRATERWNQLCFCAACQSVFLEGDGFAPVEETQSFVYESGPPLHEIAKLQQQVSYKQAIVYTAYACMFPIWIGGFVLQGMDFSTLNVGELAELAPLALLTLVLPTIGVFVVLSRRQALREHPEGGAQMAVQKEGSIGSAIVWMVVISLLLFWLPVVGPFVAGLVGGKKAGGVGAAIVAVFLPSIILGGALFLLTGALVGVPIVGAIAGMGAFALSLAGVGPLLVGAIIGGLLA